MSSVLKIENLNKKYKDSEFLLKDLNLSLDEGEIFGFLGQNGAGKSTTMKATCGIIPFDKGKISVCGYDIVSEPNKVKQNLGFVSSDDCSAYESLTGREFVNFIVNVYGVDLSLANERLERYAKMFKMEKILDFPISSYSFGYKHLINLIVVFIREPKLYIFDEPIVGLDYEFANKVKECLFEAKKNKCAVFFSSHYVEVVEKICDKVGIIKQGKLLEIINMEDLKKTGKKLEDVYRELTKENEGEQN